ncbi:hypothetical protein G8759_22105 [Spirosoma aureum]|uniref:Outer membrane beta-barrel protein n=1 Tax=Spirosoma aureum TaxID=2692134 RepID=A0A6G9ARK4_9BACT|nr:hypothetical protein [Spirosoma aureum]QIP15122.1 hypothetical protein G8759_22105 [Spirosoma aureum]
MKKGSFVFFGLACLLVPYGIHAQQIKQEHSEIKRDWVHTDATWYGALVHQHQNFFKQPFSFQGIEAGIILNHKFLISAYGATFVSTLDVERINNPLFLYVGQYGLLIGVEQNHLKPVHIGWLLNAGYFSLVGNKADFQIFRIKYPTARLGGLVVSPQVYGVLTITKWMKFRLGVGYSFYKFNEQPVVSQADLQNVAFTFGFILGKFN